ncbi:DUF5719 family protein [Stomatohabitans albus]|uniref:DUF5719 family protein n=1 Tax=Stomatohabitans albus TaxID=3110766 RepID=UPI00300DAFC0
MSRRSMAAGIACIAVATLAAGAGIALDMPNNLIGDPATATTTDLVTTLPPASTGSLTCPGTADKDTTPSILVQSVDNEHDATVNVRYLQTKGAAPDDEQFTLKAGERRILSRTSAAVLDWAGAPVQASVVDAVGGLNSRVNCATSATDQWDLVGFDTTLGSVSTLVLANPTTTPAVANLSIATPSGPVNLTLASGIEVPALNQTVIDLADYVPNVEAFSVRVSTSAGRVVASGELVRRAVDTNTAAATLGRVTGRARVVGVPIPTDQAIIPALGATQAEGVTPEQSQPSTEGEPSPQATPAPAQAETLASKDHQLIVANPNDEQVTVQAKASAPVPGEGALAGPITVPAGSVAVVKLGDISTLPNPGLVVTSDNGMPIVAAVRTIGADLDITNGVNGAATDWVVTGVDGAHVAISNPGEEPTTVTIFSPDGEDTITVGANAVTLVPSPVTGSVRLEAANPVVASLRTASVGWSLVGIASQELTGGGLAPKAVRQSTKLTTPAQNATVKLRVEPPVDLVPGGSRASELNRVPEPSASASSPTGTPTPEQSSSATPREPTGTSTLEVPSNLPAPIDEAPSETIIEDIFG